MLIVQADILRLPFSAGLDRVDRDNAVDQFLRDDLTPAEEVPMELFASFKKFGAAKFG